MSKTLGSGRLPRKGKERSLRDARYVSRLAQGQVGAALAACSRAVFFGVFF